MGVRASRPYLFALVLVVAVAMLGAVAAAGAHVARGGPGSLGKTTIDAEVGWAVGAGQPDGAFLTAEVQGVVIGLRAQQRFAGLLGVTGDRGNRVGVYQAETGSTGGNNATWNYDWHVDLSEATGRFAGRELADFTLLLEQDFTEQSLFGEFGNDPVVLPMVDGVCFSGTFDPASRCQQSWNPGFGNTDFDPHAEGTYNLRLVLAPATFHGPPLAVAIQVHVTAP